MKKSVLFTRIVFVAFIAVFCVVAGIQAHDSDSTVISDAIISINKLSDAQQHFVSKVVEEFGMMPTNGLSAFNRAGILEKRVNSLSSDVLMLLARTYDYFLLIAEQQPKSFFGVDSLEKLKAAYNAFRPQEKNKVNRMSALGELFTLVVTRLMEKQMLIYEDSGALVVDNAAAGLGFDPLKDKRYRARVLLDPAHRIFTTLMNFAPLMLMAAVQSALVVCVGVDTAAMVMLLTQMSMIANSVLLGKVDVVSCLVTYNPLLQIVYFIMRVIRDGGHWVVDRATFGASTVRLEKLANAVHVLGQCYVLWRLASAMTHGIVRVVGATYNGIMSVSSHIARGMSSTYTLFDGVGSVYAASA